jgi:hypothetical protein
MPEGTEVRSTAAQNNNHAALQHLVRQLLFARGASRPAAHDRRDNSVPARV